MAKIRLKKKSYPANLETVGWYVKPCLCGGEPRLFLARKRYTRVLRIHNPVCIRCLKCGYSTDVFDCTEYAAEQWNRRRKNQ